MFGRIKDMKLKSKLIVGTLFMVAIVMTVSALVVSISIRSQSQKAAHGLLEKALTIIADEIEQKKVELMENAQHASTVNDKVGQVKFLADYKSEPDLSTTQSTFEDISHDLFEIGVSGGIWKLAIYYMDGDLMSFVVNQGEDFIVGYALHESQLSYQFAHLKPGELITSESRKKADTVAGLDLPSKLTGKLPEKAETGFRQVGNDICLTAFVPIMGLDYLSAGEPQEKQFGVVMAVYRLDRSFLDRISRLTGMEINLFHSKGLAFGDLEGYRTLQTADPAGAQRPDEKRFINEIELESGGYYQGGLLLKAGDTPVGTVAALHSKRIVRENTWQTIRLLCLVYAACLLFMLPVSIFFSNSMTKPLHKAVGSLKKSTGRVSKSSNKVSDLSRELAESASQQAASLEETSSSLEEMASMTKQNADHAQQANQISKEGTGNLQKANQSMKVLIQSMQDISETSSDVSKIIKTIDEIAFQTNLLALNAAVEAARAGEAGAGFAVVAEEVRNLALRSADASRTTQDLITQIIKKIEAGSDSVQETDQKYREVALSVQKVSELLGEISAATDEQAHGIEQLNTSVAEMDKVTQRNASNAEGSAGAAEDLNQQADGMQLVVSEVVNLIGNGTEKKRSKFFRPDSTTQAAAAKLATPGPRNIEQRPDPTSVKSNEVPPEKIIPLDADSESSFQDF